jgi:sugar phosphate isomerase/epimerase
MKKISRRSFLGQSTLSAGSVLAIMHLPQYLMARTRLASINHPIGFEVYPVREMLVRDFPGTLKMMAGLGYQYVELCSPPGYVDDGFGPLTKLTGKETRKIVQDAGLTCTSCHFTFNEMKNNLDNRIEYAKEVGMKAMMCQSFWLPENATIKDYMNACDQLNKIAEKITQAGLVAAFHNHEMEFAKINGELIYDAMMKELDPKLVKMQFQVEVINLGYKASTYFRKYPGRFISSHLSDWTTEKKEVPIGQGIVDWKDFFAAAKTGGVKYFYVEMGLDTFKPSAAYIDKLLA